METDTMIDKNRVRKLRSQRAWSQDHLASVSDLSLRTIQRIENDGGCSCRAFLRLYRNNPVSYVGTDYVR